MSSTRFTEIAKAQVHNATMTGALIFVTNGDSFEAKPLNNSGSR